MRRIWHRIVRHQHEWRRGCRLCAEVRFHDVHEPIDYCSCGAWRQACPVVPSRRDDPIQLNPPRPDATSHASTSRRLPTPPQCDAPTRNMPNRPAATCPSDPN